jgi:KDO2-lipid IV(A) lauroyltransferase
MQTVAFLLVLGIISGMLKKPDKKKKHKQRNLVVDYLMYLLLRVTLFVMFLFPVEANLRFARFLGREMWKHYNRGRKRSKDNLRLSFPDKDEAWIEETGRKSFEQIVMLVIDVMFTPRLVKRDDWRKYCHCTNVESIKWMMQGGQGLLLLTAHYSNFEIMGYLLGEFGFNVYSIARPLDNKYISNYLFGIRERAGQKILDKKGASEQMAAMAEEHATIGFIADQDAGKKGVFVDFFGRKASTYKSIGLMAMKYNMPIAIARAARVDDRFFFDIEITRLIMPDEWENRDDPLRWITQEYTKAIEDFIREDPTQYWWLHRRWKHRPKEERAKPAVAGRA